MASPQRELVTDADRLRGQAEALMRRVRALTTEAEELRAEALELRNDADRLERVPVAVGRPKLVPVADVEHDATFCRRVCELIAAGGMTKAQIGEHLHASRMRVVAALERLEASGAVYRTGRTRGVRYHLTEPEPERTGAATLRVFTKTTPARELEDRAVAWTTEAPAPVGAVPDTDD